MAAVTLAARAATSTCLCQRRIVIVPPSLAELDRSSHSPLPLPAIRPAESRSKRYARRPVASLRIGVVGAGIIGLAVARRLAELGRTRGHGAREGGRRRAPPDRPQQRRRPCRHLLRAGLAEGDALPPRRRAAPRATAQSADCRSRSAASSSSRSTRPRSTGCASSSGGRPRTACPACAGSTATSCARSSRTPPGVAGLHSPTTAITDYRAVARAFADDVAAAAAMCSAPEVTAIARRAGERSASTARGESFEFDRLVVCAGLQSDRLARLAGTSASRRSSRSAASTTACAGPRGSRPRAPLPGARPGLPVPRRPFHAAGRRRRRRRPERRARASRARATAGGTSGRAISSRRSARRASARSPARTGGWARASCAARSRKRAFAAEARRYVPEVTAADLVPAPAGVRAQALDPDGTLVDDFRIHALGPVTAVRNAPSPGATSSLAIAEHVAGIVLEG